MNELGYIYLAHFFIIHHLLISKTVEDKNKKEIMASAAKEVSASAAKSTLQFFKLSDRASLEVDSK